MTACAPFRIPQHFHSCCGSQRAPREGTVVMTVPFVFPWRVNG